MLAIKEVISRLIQGGMDPADAAALMAAAVVEATPKNRSSGAERAARYRDRKRDKALLSVTKRDAKIPDQSVTKRDESVTKRDVVTNAHIYNLSSSLESKKEKQLPRRKPRHALPVDFQLTGPMTEYAVKRSWPQPKIDRQFEKFKNYHQSKGTLAASWPATWQQWVLNDYDAKNEPGRQASTYVDGRL